MCIRKGIPDDISALVALDHVTQLDPGRTDYIVAALHKGDAFVAERDGTVIGYGVLTYSFYGNGMLELLYVDRGYRRSGVGRSLLEYAESRCKTPKLFTSTNVTNKPMQLLLEGLGYQPSGYIDNLDPGDPELVYCKRLGGKKC